MSDERLGSRVGLGDWWSRLTVLGGIVTYVGAQLTWVHYRLTDDFIGGPADANVSASAGSFAGGGTPGNIVLLAGVATVLLGLRYSPHGGAVKATAAASVVIIGGVVWGVADPAAVAITMDTRRGGIDFTPGIGMGISLLGGFVVLAGVILRQLVTSVPRQGPTHEPELQE